MEWKNEKKMLTTRSTWCSIVAYYKKQNHNGYKWMSELRIGTSEAKFADMIWDNEPILSGDLAKLAYKEFAWKKTTAFTVLKRLCERGLFQNKNGMVSSVVSKEAFYARHSEQYVEEAFGGSLPAFLAAFGAGKKLTDKEIDEINKIIDSMRG